MAGGLLTRTAVGKVVARNVSALQFSLCSILRRQVRSCDGERRCRKQHRRPRAGRSAARTRTRCRPDSNVNSQHSVERKPMTKTIDASTLRTWLHDGGEIALLDVREAGQFGESHLLFATPVPYSQLEVEAARLVP